MKWLKQFDGTRVYGSSYDQIEFEGEVVGELNCYGEPDVDKGVLVFMPDSTLLEVKYGKNNSDIWEVCLIRKGTHFDRIEQCDNEDADPYSDVAYFKPGMKGDAYAATDGWEKVH